MAEQNLNYKRSKLIDNICGLSPIFIMTIIITDFKDASWWRYIIGTVAWFIVAGLYSALFKRFFCPEDVDNREVDNSRKVLYYLAIFGIGFIGISLFSVLPLGFAANISISIVVNFILTMLFCYYVAHAPKA